MGEPRLAKVPEFKYLKCIWDKSGTNICRVVGRWRGGAKFHVLLGPWLMLGVCMKHCLCLFSYMTDNDKDRI